MNICSFIEAMTRQYRPRYARSSPLWQCLQDSLEPFTAGYYPDRSKHLGPLDPSRETALRDSLRCGDLACGFLRVQCPDCDHHYLLPFTCKRRGCCPSCHQRRALDTAAFIRDEVCLPVPHRHWVFTIPRVLRNFELFSGPDFVAALYEHVPPKGFQTLRYYGIYSNKARGMRKNAKISPQLSSQSSSSLRSQPSSLRHRRRWRERIFAIWGCDPLKCPCCGSEMRPHKPVQDPDQIRRQLERLGLWEPITLTKACTPRAPPSTVRWILDAHDGTVIDLEPEVAAAWMPTAPRYKRERADPASNPTQVSGLIPHPSDDGLVLEIEDPDPWAQDNEPIFWTD